MFTKESYILKHLKPAGLLKYGILVDFSWLPNRFFQVEFNPNQLTGFYMRGTLVVKGLNEFNQ